MTNDNHQDNPAGTDEKGFSDLLDSYQDEGRVNIQVGDRIRGKIISIGKENIFIDTGFKVDGIVEREELADENGDLPYSEGDTIDLFVVSRKGGEIRLSRAISGVGGLSLLEDAYEKAIPVEGKVLEECKGGFRVEVVKRKAFCPLSQMDATRIEDPALYVGKTTNFSSPSSRKMATTSFCRGGGCSKKNRQRQGRASLTSLKSAALSKER